jgi:hypothetical protein
MNSPAFRYLAFGLTVAWCGAPLLRGVEPPKNPAPKTHALFMGVDVIVEQNKKQYRIEDVAGSQFKITVDGKETLVSTRNKQTGLGVAYNLKLSGTSVQLDNFQAGPGYTPENDPMNQLKDAAGLAATVAAQQDLAQAQIDRDTQNVTALAGAVAHSTNPEERANNQAALDRALADQQKTLAIVDNLAAASVGEITNVGAGAHRMQVAEGNYDAMVVSFKVSSPVELASPYMIALFRFHDPAAKPGVNGLVIHAQALDPINSKPSYVRVLRGGLPAGFQFVDCTVHIFNRGRELATNVSEKRVDLTHDEAQQYFLMEYVSANKKATAAAGAMPGSLPLQQREQLTPEQLTRTIHVKVSKDGTMLGVFTDADCNHPLKDTVVTMAASELFYKPALNEGKPMEGVARLRLADF